MSASVIMRSELIAPAVQKHRDDNRNQSEIHLADKNLFQYLVLIFGKMLDLFR
jgi:hypothetical protein